MKSAVLAVSIEMDDRTVQAALERH